MLNIPKDFIEEGFFVHGMDIAPNCLADEMDELPRFHQIHYFQLDPAHKILQCMSDPDSRDVQKQHCHHDNLVIH